MKHARLVRLIPRCLGLIFPGLFFLISCTNYPATYSTDHHNIPVFHEKGENLISAGTSFIISGSEGSFIGTHLSGAKAFTDHLAAISNLSGYCNDLGYVSRRGYNVELGIGGFKYWSKSGLVGEVFGGCGYSALYTSDSREAISIPNQNDPVSKFSASYFRPFIQPSLAYSNETIDVAFCPKVCLVRYLNYSFPLDQFYHKQPTWVFEPCIMFRLKLPSKNYYRTWAKGLEFQVGSSTLDGVQSRSIYKMYVSVGLFFLKSKRYEFKG